jgi:hypothetical protein
MPTQTRDEFCDVTFLPPRQRIDQLPDLPASLARLFDGSDHAVCELLQAAALL